MSVNDIISFTIEVNNSGVAEEGFGTPLYLSYDATFPDLVRTYNDLPGVLADFAADSATGLIAAQVFAQSPHPVEFKVGRGTLKPTLQYVVGAIQVNNSYPYKIQVDGPGITSTEATYSSDSSATKQEIHNGLVAQLNAVVGKNYTATFAPLVYADQTFTADSSTDQLHVVAHGLNTGDGPFQVSNSGGALPAGLTALTDYYVVKVDADNFKLATSLTNALAGTIIDITSNGTGTQTISDTVTTVSPILPFLVTGNSAGNWFSIDIENPSVLSNKMNHADPGVATDLAAIFLVDEDWYWLLTNWNSKAYVEGAALWVEDNSRAYNVAVVDTDALNTTAGNGDTLDALNGLSYKRTAGWYHNSPKQALDACFTGAIAAFEPGTWDGAFKELAAVTTIKLTPTQTTNLKARRGNWYRSDKGRKFTWEGFVFSVTYGYIDITVAIDWFTDQCVDAALGYLLANKKTAYTDRDIDNLAGAIRGVLHDATSDAHPVLDPGDPTDATNLPPSITFPKVADIAPGKRAVRNLPNGIIRGRLQGAIHTVDFIATLSF